MKKQIKFHLPAILFPLILLLGCQKHDMQAVVDSPAAASYPINAAYTKAAALQDIIRRYAKQGIPGITITLYDDQQGWWESAAGYARIEDRTAMRTDHLQYLQSVAKTYTAAALLLLHEENRIDLDKSIQTYLPSKYRDWVKQADQVTVRMLLNHTSGIADYTDDINYTSYLLQHPLQKLKTEDLLRYIKGKKPGFQPGSQFDYSNTNYELLALIMDEVTGDHGAYLQRKVFEPLSLNHTFYRGNAGYPGYSLLVNSYLDRYSIGSIENVSQWQTNNVSSMIGDDGIVATPRDAVTFLKGLFEGRLLTQSSLQEMTKWVSDDKGASTYGMGLYHYDLTGTEAIGHGGSGIGAGCALYYLPAKKLYFYLGVNLGTIVEGPLVDKISKMKDEITDVLAK